MIEVKNLSKSYGDFQAIQDINFKVEDGEIFSLLGSNGAGKTTIIKTLVGLLNPSGGEALIDGKPVKEDKDIKRRFGYMPEQPHLYRRLTGREFLEMMGSLRGVKPNVLEKKINDMAGEMELRDMLDSEMGAYSKGMKQKVMFANAIIPDPKNLVLDEPTTGLDPRFTKYLKDRIISQAEKGKAVLMSTHITSVAEVVADRVAIIDHGNVVEHGPVKELMEQADNGSSLEDVFVEVVHNERHRG